MNAGLRIWVPASVLAIVAVLAGGWFIGAQPLVASAATTDQTTATVEATNSATRLRLVDLSKQAAKVGDMRVEDAALQKAVPSILKPNRFVRRVNELAALDGVLVTGISPSPALAYAPAASLTQAAGTPGALALGKTDPSITGANFTVVPMTVTVSGTAAQVKAFAHDLQNDERLFAISSFQTTKNDGGSVTGSLAGAIYTLTR